MTKSRKLAIFADGIDAALWGVQEKLDRAKVVAADYERQWRKENPEATPEDMKAEWWWDSYQEALDRATVLPELIRKLENLTL